MAQVRVTWRFIRAQSQSSRLWLNIQIDMLDRSRKGERALVLPNWRGGILADIEGIFERKRHSNRFGQSRCCHWFIVHQQRKVCAFSKAVPVVRELQGQLSWAWWQRLRRGQSGHA